MKAMTAIRVNIDKELHKAVRIQAVRDEVPLAVILTAALRDYLAKRQRSSARVKVQ